MEDSKELQQLIFEGNKKLKQNIKQYKNNVRHDYDKLVIEKFKKENPKIISKLEKQLIKKQPYLKYKKESLDKKIDNFILPPILEKSDGYFYSISDKDKSGKTRNKTFGGYHLPLIEDINERTHIILKGEKIMIEIIEDLLDEFSEEDSTLLKAIYGIPPFSESDIDFIKETYNLTENQIEEKHDKLIKILRGKMNLL